MNTTTPLGSSTNKPKYTLGQKVFTEAPVPEEQLSPSTDEALEAYVAKLTEWYQSTTN